MSDAETPSTTEYVVGETHPRAQSYASFETKPTTTYADGSVDTGGGYER